MHAVYLIYSLVALLSNINSPNVHILDILSGGNAIG